MKTAQWIATSCLFLVLALPAPVGAVGVPQKFNVQGVLRNADRSLVPDNTPYTLLFRMYADEVAAVPFWEKTSVVTPKAGVFSVNLDFVLADMQNKAGVWLEMSVVERGVPRQVWKKPVLSIPYAVNAQFTDNANYAATATEGANMAVGSVVHQLTCLGCVSGGANGDLEVYGPGHAGVTVDNLAAGAVTSAKILDGEILFTDLAFNPSLCPANSVWTYNGSAWGCVIDHAKLGTVRTLLKGNGITMTDGLGGTGSPVAQITDIGTVSVTPGGVTNTMLAASTFGFNAGTGIGGGGTVALGDTVTLRLSGTVAITNGGLNRTDGCTDGQLLRSDGTVWACANDQSQPGTITSVAVTDPLVLSPLTGSPLALRSGAGTLSLGILRVIDGGTGLGTLPAGNLFRGNGTSAILPSLVYADDSGVAIGGTATTGGMLTVNGNPGLALALGAAGADLSISTNSNAISIGSGTTSGMQFYDSYIDGGPYEALTNAGVQFFPDVGKVIEASSDLATANHGILNPVGGLRMKYQTRTFTTGGSATFVAVAFSDTLGWNDGPMELEITKSAGQGGWAGTLQAQFTCHNQQTSHAVTPPAVASGTDYCYAEIHNGGTAGNSIANGYVAAYKNDLGTAAQFVVWLRANTTYSYRSNQMVDLVSADYGGLGIATVETNAWNTSTNNRYGVVAPSGIRMEHYLSVSPAGTATPVLYLGTENEPATNGPDGGSATIANKYMVEANQPISTLGNLGGITGGIKAYYALDGTAGARTIAAATANPPDTLQPYVGKKPTIDVNPDDASALGFTVGTSGGFFRQTADAPIANGSNMTVATGTKIGRFIAFAGNSGLDMNGRALRRGCPRGWRTFNGDGTSHTSQTTIGFCMAESFPGATYSNTGAACNGLLAGARPCTPDEIRKAIVAMGGTGGIDSWYLLFVGVWLNDQIGANSALFVQGISPYNWGVPFGPAGSTSDPVMMTGPVTDVRGTACCYPL